ncbi:hypothetical protein SCHPADRAFT_818406 [Schizopora paradoxa]|uniref:GRIP domain-containing protein n=1 Tax=Schizopora paradoxa TaxID=27342 RepID=A0A0H2S527_9AGAM|nr:hypothetical protein SCHPADRAFT_818406 [Schizopora paradoxa]
MLYAQEELDRREQAIQQLSAQNDDLQQTIETLQSEVITSNSEAERASRELVNLRSRALEESSEEALTRERELREIQLELEHCRTERDDWEREALEGRVAVDEAKSSLASLKRELDSEREFRQKDKRDLELEREKSQNLQSVLEDFQAGKDHELREAVRDRDAQISEITQLLAEYKHRAHSAEMQLEENSSDSSRTVELEKQVKEKSVLIEKLRHEAVIMNEHLMEALRRLRKSSTDNNVDRRLVTNVLLQFLTTPRADVKRFEMLGLLATILSWNDVEREKAGLQKSSQPSGRSSGGRTVSASHSKGKGMDLENSDETESFSQRWVEFLLKESNDSSSPPIPQSPTRSSSNSSLPGSPRSTQGSPIPQRTSRLASFTSLAMASSPNLAPSRTTQNSNP